MAKKQAVRNVESNVPKSQVIREWFAKNPDGTASQCQKALAASGVEVGSGHCQQVLTRMKGGGKVDVETIKKAAAFISEHGDVRKAIAAIDAVGEFIADCGSPAKAKSALEAYQSVAAVIG